MSNFDLVDDGLNIQEPSNPVNNAINKIKAKTPAQLVLIACGILATLSVSGGMISIFAHNWYEYSKGIRVVLSMIPILTGIAVFAYALFKHDKSKVWMECSAVYLVLMTGSSIGLISQVYNLGGTFERFLVIWMLTSLPIIYLANSSLSAILYGWGIGWWAYLKFIGSWSFFGPSLKDPNILYYFILIAAIVPHFIQNVKPGVYSLRSVVMGWVLGGTFLSAVSIVFLQHQAVGVAIALVFLYAAGKYFYQNEWFWMRPFQTIALMYIIFLGIAYTFDDYLRYTLEANDYMGRKREYMPYSLFGADEPAKLTYSGKAVMFNYLGLLALVGATVWTFMLNAKRSIAVNWALVSFPLVLAIGLYIGCHMKSDMDKATWWFNIYLFGLGAYYMIKGYKMKINALVALGIAVISLDLLIRYFDTDMSFYLKGLVYLAVGGGFLAFNYYFSQHETENNES